MRRGGKDRQGKKVDRGNKLTASPSSVSGAAVTFPENQPSSAGSHPASKVPCAAEWFDGRKPVGAKWNSRVSPTLAVRELGLKTKVSSRLRSWTARMGIVFWALVVVAVRARVARRRIVRGGMLRFVEVCPAGKRGGRIKTEDKKTGSEGEGGG